MYKSIADDRMLSKILLRSFFKQTILDLAWGIVHLLGYAPCYPLLPLTRHDAAVNKAPRTPATTAQPRHYGDQCGTTD